MPEPLPEIAALLTLAPAGLAPDLSLPELRAVCDAGVVALHRHVRDRGPLHDVQDLVSPGGVPVRLYLPSDRPGPLHLFVHGGGWWMGSIETADPMVRELAHALGMAVASVGYRLAPEHPWPAAPEDVYEVLTWLAQTYDSISIGGESAGANLAAVVALMARDRGGPRLVAQWLDVPAVDLGRMDDPSMRDFGSGYGLELAQFPMMISWYAQDVAHPYVSPLRADLAGLPPAIVTTAELDPVRDQGEDFARALEAAGVPVRLLRSAGHIHGSTWLTALTPSAAQWHDEVVALLLSHHALEAST